MRVQAISHNLFHNTNAFKAKSVKSFETAPIKNTVAISKEEAQTVLQKGD